MVTNHCTVSGERKEQMYMCMYMYTVHVYVHDIYSCLLHILCVLQGLLSDDQVASAPILILGNKIDIPGACSEDELRTVFSLHGRTTGKVRRKLWCMYTTS